MTRLRVMTFNIRTALADDGDDHWDRRKPLVYETIRGHDPDLLGLQEPTPGQWAEVARALGDGWRGAGHDRQDGPPGRTHLQGGFIRAARMELEGDGVFWLSDTPDVPGSVSYPQDWGPRTCSWMRLLDRAAGRALVFAVTHLDTNGASWLPGARVLAAQLDRIAGGVPVILVGDFNCAAGSEAHRFITGQAGFRDAWREAGHADEGVTSFNAFRPVSRLPLEDPALLERWLHETCDPVPQFAHYPAHVLAHRNYRIDWILSRGPLRVTTAALDVRAPGGRLPSDHYPVIATLEWN